MVRYHLIGVLLLCSIRPVAAQVANSGVIAGTITDSVHATPLSRASVRATPLWGSNETTVVSVTDERGRFRFDGVVPGRYAVSFLSSLLDSLEFGGPVNQVLVTAGDTSRIDLAIPSAATLRGIVCPGTRFAARTGVLTGSVTEADAEQPLTGAKLLVAWNEIAIDSASRGVSTEQRVVSATTDENGQYRLCGVPSEQPLIVQIQYEDRAGSAQRLTISNAVGVLVRNLSFSAEGAHSLVAVRSRTAGDTVLPKLTGSASVSGVVRTEGGQPITGAQVTVINTASANRTDERGQYFLGGLPAGTHDLEVRHFGYVVERSPVELRRGVTARMDVRLDRLVMLDSVAVIAQRKRYPEFESHRTFATNARFVTEAEIDRLRDHSTDVGDMVQKIPGWGGRVAGQGSNSFAPGCDVIVDNMRMDSVPGPRGQPTGGLLNAVNRVDVGSIELYPPRSTSAPMEYHSKTGCVIMIWTKTWADQRAKKR